MRGTAWNNGSHSRSGSGYGIRIRIQDRDRFFEPGWDHVVLDLGGEAAATVRISESFWRTCAELRSAEIGRWLLRRKVAPWPSGQPPVLEVDQVQGNRFTVVVGAIS
jgi:hypothetical protein